MGGRVGPEPEDFQVDELPLYAASGKGEHQYLQVRKRLLTTPELVRRLARACDVSVFTCCNATVTRASCRESRANWRSTTAS